MDQTVTEAFETAYALELHKVIETEILLPFGITRDDFIQKGKEWFGEVVFKNSLIKSPAST